MTEMMKVEADEPGGFSSDPHIPAASTSEPEEETQDSKDLMFPLHQMLVVKAEVPRDWNSSLDQQDPERPHIKEEEEEQCISHKEMHLTVKSEDEEKTELSERHQIKTEDRRSAEQLETQPEPDWNPDLTNQRVTY
ncbi:uncharacterized protein LOC122823667 isoform X3 [Gambusia affinis]|uniref:uncharacterized protein LOC122823667 isoform X3 n=1 Tax=Gambusia affinis TaxID=33528 RepID=UPI001CDC0AA4|nr:uncharacterized protein LOC122823667 isoform X3 [Gambusia affinis]